MKDIRVRYVAAILAGILLVAVYAVPRFAFGQSVTELVSEDLGADVRSCRDAGLKVVAGERESVYTCTYVEHDGTKGGKYKQYRSVCVAIIDGRVYGAGETC